jgi:hypothetical protein
VTEELSPRDQVIFIARKIAKIESLLEQHAIIQDNLNERIKKLEEKSNE